MLNIEQGQIIRLLGFGFVLIGLAARLGYWKKWYWKTSTAAYGYIPLGLVFILFSYNELAEGQLGDRYFLYLIGFGFLAICVVWFTQRPMNFLKPRWVRWVEVHPARIRKLMEQQVEDGEDWEHHIESQETVDAWARRLKGKPLRPKQKGRS